MRRARCSVMGPAWIAAVCLIVFLGSATAGDAEALGYVVVPGMGSYKVHEEWVPWQQAEDTCVGEGGHLLVPDSQDKLDLVASLTPRHPWVGLRLQAGSYVTPTGDIVENPLWARDEPDSSGQCVFADSEDKALYDFDCNDVDMFVLTAAACVVLGSDCKDQGVRFTVTTKEGKEGNMAAEVTVLNSTAGVSKPEVVVNEVVQEERDGRRYMVHHLVVTMVLPPREHQYVLHHGHGLYRRMPAMATTDAMQGVCTMEGEGAVVVLPATPEEAALVWGMALPTDLMLGTGVRRDPTHGDLYFRVADVKGSSFPIEGVLWDASLEEPDYSGNCVALTPSKGLLIDVHCDASLPFVCKKPLADGEWSQAADIGHWLKFIPTHTPFPDISRECLKRGDGVELAYPYDGQAASMEDMAHIMANVVPSADLLLAVGISRAEGDLYTVRYRGDEVFTEGMWDVDDDATAGDCVALVRTTAKLRHYDCNTLLPFMCMKTL